MIKELLAILRDPKGRIVLIAPPLMQLLIFSFAATLEVSGVEIAVVHRDSGRWSHELLQRVAASPTFAEVRPAENLAAARRALDMQQVVAVLHLRADFSRAIEAGRPASVQILLDGRRSNAAQIVAGYLEQIIGSLSAEAPAATSLSSPAQALIVRNWFNPNLIYIWYTVPSLVGIITLLVGLIVTALSVARERELGTFDQLMVSPLRTHEILIGKVVPPLAIGLVHGTLYVLAAVLIFGVPLRGSLPLLYASLVFYLAAVVGVGLFISSLSSTQQQAILGAFLFAAPAVLLSGFATPVENMPPWLQTVTLANPLRHFLVVVKGIFLKDLPAAEALSNTWPLALIALATLTTAAWLFRSKTA
ncbi:MAG: ABC transporter permease [Geminicoccaceae bacterium]|nr:ABC transporter permease [Geminicoccaceae bacterium]